ncbi:hypothetical protein GCM10017581_038430 [Dactylosporangium matsuzakiense]|uniref:Secreted protein n=1 Tax=Dactylosporangium matsuzakiense TaxID=53360 RepID=A0A9W6KHB1_9ACTN|nr:hypothetical protein GCM10017581_038430 [Dactylosporangium matsuzakiense]
MVARAVLAAAVAVSAGAILTMSMTVGNAAAIKSCYVAPTGNDRMSGCAVTTWSWAAMGRPCHLLSIRVAGRWTTVRAMLIY